MPSSRSLAKKATLRASAMLACVAILAPAVPPVAAEGAPWTIALHLVGAALGGPRVVDASLANDESLPSGLWEGTVTIDGVEYFGQGGASAVSWIFAGSYSDPALSLHGVSWWALPDGSWPAAFDSSVGGLAFAGTLDVSGHP